MKRFIFLVATIFRVNIFYLGNVPIYTNHKGVVY